MTHKPQAQFFQKTIFKWLISSMALFGMLLFTLHAMADTQQNVAATAKLVSQSEGGGYYQFNISSQAKVGSFTLTFSLPKSNNVGDAWGGNIMSKNKQCTGDICTYTYTGASTWGSDTAPLNLTFGADGPSNAIPKTADIQLKATTDGSENGGTVGTVPATPQLTITSAAVAGQSGMYNVTVKWDLTGTTAKTWTLYENSQIVGNANTPIAAQTPNTQTASVVLNNRAAGTYTYKVVLTNDTGSSEATSTYKAGEATPPPPTDGLQPIPVTTTVNAGMITLTNSTDAAISTRKMSVSFNYEGDISSIWGQPWAAWKVDSKEGTLYTLSGGEEWGTGKLAPGASLTIQFTQAPGTASASNVSFRAVSDKPVALGSINIHFPAAPSQDIGQQQPTVTVTGPSQPSGKEFTGSWEQALPVASLMPGQYTVTVPGIKVGTKTYMGSVDHSSVTLTEGGAASVNVNYAAQAEGNLKVSMGSAPESNMPNPTVTVKNDTTGATLPTPQAEWSKSFTVTGLLANQPYTISANKITFNNKDYAPTVNHPQVQVAQDNDTVETSISYTVVAPPAVEYGNVNATVSGDPTGKNINVTFTNTTDQSQVTKTLALSSTAKLQLPVGSYTVSADSTDFNGKNYYASVTPYNVTVAKDGTEPSINISYQPQSGKIIAGYDQSWSAPWVSKGVDTQLAKYPSYLNMIILSFMKPDTQYAGNLSLENTGLDYSFGGPILKEAIAAVHAKNPGTKVIIAIGGATYTNWEATNASAVAKFVKDFGLDGVDIDYEPSLASCQFDTGKNRMVCAGEENFISIIKEIRAKLPPPYVVSVAAFSTGAFGQDQWKNAQPAGSQYKGIMIYPLSQVGSLIDQVNVMSYDASDAYDPIEALAAYQHYFKGKVVMGVEVPPEAWGGHVFTMDKVNALAQAVKQNNAGGLMIWSLQKAPNGTPSGSNPSAQMMLQSACQIFSSSDCEMPLFGK